jgi:hypothetical protein
VTTEAGQPAQADWPGGPEEQGGQLAAGADQVEQAWPGGPEENGGQQAPVRDEPERKRGPGEDVWPAQAVGPEGRAGEKRTCGEEAAGWSSYGEERHGCQTSCGQTTAPPRHPGTG